VEEDGNRDNDQHATRSDLLERVVLSAACGLIRNHRLWCRLDLCQMRRIIERGPHHSECRYRRHTCWIDTQRQHYEGYSQAPRVGNHLQLTLDNKHPLSANRHDKDRLGIRGVHATHQHTRPSFADHAQPLVARHLLAIAGRFSNRGRILEDAGAVVAATGQEDGSAAMKRSARIGRCSQPHRARERAGARGKKAHRVERGCRRDHLLWHSSYRSFEKPMVWPDRVTMPAQMLNPRWQWCGVPGWGDGTSNGATPEALLASRRCYSAVGSRVVRSGIAPAAGEWRKAGQRAATTRPGGAVSNSVAGPATTLSAFELPYQVAICER
jgi:hypothetical protein